MQEADIHVAYRNVPPEVVKPFEDLTDPNLSVSIHHDKKLYFSFDGGPSNILVYFGEHLTEIIVNGLIVAGLYDGIKYTIKSVWTRIVQHYRQKNYEIQDDKNQIEVRFSIKPDKTIEFFLEGDVDEAIIDKTVDKVFEYLSNQDQRSKDFQNPDFQDFYHAKPYITVKYNSDSGAWEPINYTEMKVKRKKIKDDFDD